MSGLMHKQSSSYDYEPLGDYSSQNKRAWGCGAFVGLAVLVLALAVAAYFLGPRFFPNKFGPDAATPEPVIVTIEQILPLGELATVQYKSIAEVSNERIPDDVRKYLNVKEKVVMLVYGDVKAGFDLNKIGPNDLWVEGKRVQLTLPPPEILSASVDFERTHIVAYNKSFIFGNDPALEQATLAMGKKAIIDSALENDVLELARQYGKLFFENHLRSLGFEEVRVFVK